MFVLDIFRSVMGKFKELVIASEIDSKVSSII